jgi:C4-dicarboxylate-specific signal transduction histidine kinase
MVGRLLIVRDVSSQKEAEQDRLLMETKIQQGQKLESLGVLAGGIAHEFNNLLQGILGNTEIALDDPVLTDLTRDKLIQVNEISERAAKLCRQLLAYSGKGRFVVQPLDFNEVIREMAELLDVSISKRVSIQYALADNPAVVSADPTQMQQLVMNLVMNAAEALEDDIGSITISTDEVDLDPAELAQMDLWMRSRPVHTSHWLYRIPVPVWTRRHVT